MEEQLGGAGTALPAATRRALRSIVIRDNLWHSGSPTVCFGPGENVSPRGDLIQKIMKIADEWTEGTDIKFDWGAPAPRICNSMSSANIRVYLAPPPPDRGPLFVSVIGNTSTKEAVDGYEPYSVVLEFPDEGTALGSYYLRDEVTRFYVLHEFGHALGFEHEHQRTDCHYNWQYIKTRFNFQSIQDAKDNMKQLYWVTGAFPNNEPVIDGKYIFTKYDNYSVMKYNLSTGISSPQGDDPQVYEEGLRSACYRSGWVSTLTEYDHAGAIKAYNKPNVAAAVIAANLTEGPARTATRSLVVTRSLTRAVTDPETAKIEAEVNSEIAAVRKSPKAMKLLKRILAARHQNK